MKHSRLLTAKITPYINNSLQLLYAVRELRNSLHATLSV